MIRALPCLTACLSVVSVLVSVIAIRPKPSFAQAPSDATGSVHTLNPLSALDLATLDSFKARPLFSVTRRPPPVLPQVLIPPPPTPVASPAPDLRLIGVVSSADRAIAILRRSTGGSSLSLKVGDRVESWQVQAISPDRVILREGDREQIYRLFAGGGAANAPAPNRLTSGAPSASPQGFR